MVVTIWIISDVGFVSLVVNKHDTNLIQVRSRLSEDITAIFPNAKVYISNGADYRYRSDVRRSEVAVVLAEKVLNMDYTSHVKDVAIERSHPSAGRRNAYYSMWSSLGQMQDYAPYSTVSRAQAAARLDQHKYPQSKTPAIFSTGGQQKSRWDEDLDQPSWWPSGLPDAADDRWTTKDLVDTDKDLPDYDPETEEIINSLEDRYGLAALDAMSEDEWDDLLRETLKEHRQQKAQKAQEFSRQGNGNGGKRNRKRRRNGRRR